MGDKETTSKKIKFPVTNTEQGDNLSLPGILNTSTRSGVNEIDPLLEGLVVEKVYQLGSASRGGPAGTPTEVKASEGELLAIEAEDGTTIFIRSDKLAEDIERIRPEAIIDGEIDFTKFRDPNDASRGVDDIFWKAVTLLKLPTDDMLEKAKELAKEWAIGKAEDKAYDVGSFLGAKALMWKIESRLAGNPGLYEWKGLDITSANHCSKDDTCMEKAGKGDAMLLLIHGTASYTQSGFDDLRKDDDTWRVLRESFPGGIFGYEHRTFSQSPIENALELVKVLPKNARISVLTHSRGGLVGDLLCLGRNINTSVIDAYQIDTKDSDDAEGLKQEEQKERQRLHDLLQALEDKDIIVKRYVRVASPARGTRLLSANLDAALSDFTNLLQITGGALAGAAAGAIGGPAAAKVAGKGTSSALGVLKRLVLEIAGRRIDPRMIPGIAAMRIDSPLASFLAHPETRRHDDTKIAVIAGDTDFNSLGLSNFRRRVANLFCDWRLFDQQDNDMVVDTDSMYAGLGFEKGVHYLLDQATSVTHFRYFGNPTTRDALRAWLVEDDLSSVPQFLPLSSGKKVSWDEREARQKKRSGVDISRPVVILIPGIMGSHLEINRKDDNKQGSGNRIWFDIPSLMKGDLDRIGYPSTDNVFAEDIFERFYGDLAEYLYDTHVVIRSPYDWRRTLKQCAVELLDKVNEAIQNHPNQPVRLLAHSIGGLVVRTLIKEHPDSWKQVIDSGGRLVMLGTPNNGSHSMVHTLLGKNNATRMLSKLDLERGHDLQYTLDIVRQYPGALSLLPRPGFADAGNTLRINSNEYYDKNLWDNLKEISKDSWFSNKVVGVPEQDMLDEVKHFWTDTLANNTITNPEHVNYVFGQGDKTPCGVVRTDNNRLKMLFTPDGDGTVTWKSGQLQNLDRDHCWYMPVEHGDLLGEKQYFPAIVDLLEKGTTGKLARLPRTRGIAAETFVLDAPPPIVPSEEELMRALMGSGVRKRKTTRLQKTLKVSVRSGDLYYCTSPVLCGHYYGDVISGAESILNIRVDNQLSKRQRMGVYADAIGTSTIVLMPPNTEERRRKTRRGAIIVGLGEMNGHLSSTSVTESVRAGVLHLLLRTLEVPEDCGTNKIKLTSLLIGQNSTTHISIGESLAAVVRGICEANAKFNSDKAYISEIEFIELYRDVAITAAHAIRDLPERIAGDLERLDMHLNTVHELQVGEGSRNRLWAESSSNYWPRLIVTDADKDEEQYPAKATVSGHHYPDRLRYVFVSERARSENIAMQRQPGLIESIVKKQLYQKHYNTQLSRTLFELMIPLDFKPTAREIDTLVLQVDGYTANLPWELLQADNNEPMVIKTAIIRQLSTKRFRRNVRTAPSKTACIIVDPSTDQYDVYFDRSSGVKLPLLNEAVREGDIVSKKLKEAGYLDDDISYSPSGADALDVLHKLLSRPYRLLVIAAHGIFEAKHCDGKLRTGVVLSGGALITAAEIGQMEVVPELVFLNCCHLGNISTGAAFNRLAYSLSRELIEMGVRCIVAAGWAVDDKAACTFADKFFDEMLINKNCFGHAVHAARVETYNSHRSSNTWGAYQAYGDPGYQLDPNDSNRAKASYRLSAVDELLHELTKILMTNKKPGFQKPGSDVLRKVLSELRERVPSEWLEYPQVLEMLGRIYADIAKDGFEIARDYYLQAIAREDKQGVVAIKTIEQLANMEARAGEHDAENGKELIQSAIKRLEALRVISTSAEKNIMLNPERAALLGSAYKSLASHLRNHTGSKWVTISKVLEKCAKAYKQATLFNTDPASTPYNTLNYLQFGLLVKLAGGKNAKQDVELAHRCAETARKNFEKSGSFWDAVMPADAEVTAWLLGAQIKEKNVTQHLVKVYQESINDIPVADRQMDSVIKNLHLLAKFLRLRNQTGDKKRAGILDKISKSSAFRAG